MKFYLNQRDQEVLYEVVRQRDGACRFALMKSLGMSHSQIHYATKRLLDKRLIAVTRRTRTTPSGPETTFYGVTRKGNNQIEKMAKAIVTVAWIAGIPI